MKEIVFIQKNEKYWTKFEEYLQNDKAIDPDELAEDYIRLTDDLSYAKTFYPESPLTGYLNELALRLHQRIYKNKKEKKNRIREFWLYEVPKAIYDSRKELLYACIIFSISIGIGLFSSFQDDSYVNLILGDSYINMTEENISAGDPMAVYKDASHTSMFFGISSNNIRVSFLAFVIGIFGSVLTGLLLFYNGVMVGAFQYFFISKGMFWISFSTIFIHGALELSAIVIAGGAGIVLGNSFLYPGTYSRGRSLRIGGKKSLKIVMGLVPVFILAALLESYVTRYYLELGSGGRALIIILSFAFVFWYFIYFPRKLFKNES
jgi:uncharacterized membrane protein SpoIIM required for sporulation